MVIVPNYHENSTSILPRRSRTTRIAQAYSGQLYVCRKAPATAEVIAAGGAAWAAPNNSRARARPRCHHRGQPRSVSTARPPFPARSFAGGESFPAPTAAACAYRATVNPRPARGARRLALPRGRPTWRIEPATAAHPPARKSRSSSVIKSRGVSRREWTARGAIGRPLGLSYLVSNLSAGLRGTPLSAGKPCHHATSIKCCRWGKVKFSSPDAELSAVNARVGQ